MRAVWISFACAVVCLIPLLSGLLWKRRIGNMRPVWMGMLGFFAFSAIVETVFVALCLSSLGPVTAFLNASPVRLIVFSCLCAALFEEWGRYWIYQSGLPQCEGRAIPIGYAIGHFGAEIVILTVYPLLSRTPEVFGALQAGIVIWERAVACAGHTALSVLVWYAYSRRKKKPLFAAILLHALCDVPLGMLRYGLTGQFRAELGFSLGVAVLATFAFRYWRKLPEGAMIKV